MPTLDEILKKSGNAAVITKLDLPKGYFQVQVALESRPLPAFCCPFGKFEFKMPFIECTYSFSMTNGRDPPFML